MKLALMRFGAALCLVIAACSPAPAEPTPAVVVSDEVCPQIVAQALDATDRECNGTARNQICYGNVNLEATPQAGVENFQFAQPGDMVDITALQSLRLSSMNTTTQEWGVALMQLQANLPDTLPGQNVTILLFGNVEIENATSDDGELAFYFQSGIGDAPCAEAPDSGILVQTPEGVSSVSFRVNEVDIELGSTAYLQAQPSADMDVSVVEGQAIVSAQGVAQIVRAGATTGVPLDANRAPSGPPSPPVPYTATRLQTLPVNHLRRSVGISTILASSTFSTDAESWMMQGDGSEIAYSAADATSDGYVCSTDTSSGVDWFFQAPETWLGDRSAAYGGSLSFVLRQSGDDQQYDSDDVLLTGGGITLKYNTAENPGLDWTPFNVPLVETAGWVNTTTGVPPTRDEMMSVLSALTEIKIRGEYREGDDTGCLDYAQLTGVILPTVGGQVVQPTTFPTTEPTLSVGGQVVVTPTLTPGPASSAPIGLEVADTITTAGETDTYTFDAQAGQQVYFDALDSDGTAIWTLTDPGGQQVFYHILDTSTDPGRLTLEESGTYSIGVTGNSDRTGDYRFQVWDAAALEMTIAVGDTVSDGVPVAGAGNIESTGGQDIYLFDAQAGQRVYFDALDSDGVAVWSLIDPSGRQLFYHGLDTSTDPGRFAMEESGTYSILVHGSGDSTGAYRFKIWDAAAQEITIAVGDTVSNGVPTVGAGNIESAGGQDIYLFEGQVGQRVFFDALNSDGIAVWTLTDPTGRQVFYHLLDASTDPGLLTLQESGTYSILVHGSGDSTGAYEFQLQDGSAMVTAVATTAASGLETQIGFEAADLISVAGELDTYTLDAEAGHVLYMDGMGENSLIRATLTDATGTAVAPEWWLDRDNGLVTFEQAGTYTLTVFGAQEATGTYAFKLWDVPPPQTFTINIGDTVSDGEPGDGAGNIESPGARDIYTFTVEAGQTLYMDGLGSLSTLRALLTDVAGTSLVPEWWLDRDNGSVTLASGTYTLTVYGWADSIGVYSFKLWDVPPPETFEFTIGDTISDGVPGAGAGSIESPGVQDIYAFTAEAGQTIYMDGLGDNSALRALLTDAAGTALAPEWWLDRDNGTVTLEAGGTYTLTVYGWADSTGTYSFKLWDVPPPETFEFTIGDTISDGVPGAGAGNIESPGVQDIYTFTAEAGQTIYLDGMGDNSALRAQLTDAAGTALAPEWWLDRDNGTVTLEEGGMYTLTVYGWAETTGVYSFKLWDVPPAQTFTINIGDTVSDGEPGDGAGNIESPGMQDIYTFTAQPGATVQFIGQGEDSLLRWTVTDEAGTVIFQDQWLDREAGVFTLEAGGTYTITVYGWAETTGPYQFQLVQQ
jgi:hypothetical protein